MNEVELIKSYSSITKIKKHNSILKIFWKQKVLFMFLLPSVILLFVFNYIPMIGLLMAFQNYQVQKGFFGSEFIGVHNFLLFLNDSDFYLALKNTLGISVLLILFGFPAPVLLALVLDNLKNRAFKKISQTITYLPYFISWVIVATLVYRVLDPESGIVNFFIQTIGGEKIEFMRRSELFWPILILSAIWKDIGWNSIIYMAAISGIDQELYSAAMIDGAGRLKRIIFITIPSIMPTIALLFILSLGGLVRVNFDAVFNLMNPLLYTSAEVIDTFVFRTGIQHAKYSYATAIGLVQSIVSIIIVFIGFRIVKKNNDYTIF